MPDMQNNSTKEGKSCCSGGHGCCGTKRLLVLVLVLLAGVIGYLIGTRGSYGWHRWHHGGYGCPMGMMGTSAPSPAPAM